MAAQFKFEHGGVTVLVFEKSIRMTGMHDCLFLGHTPDVEQIKRMIDAIQAQARPELPKSHPVRLFKDVHAPRYRVKVPEEPGERSLRERFLRWWYGL